MPLVATLARVDDDLAAGRVVLARQRLRGLVASFPDRLDLRERLAAAYRLAPADPAQAGRWASLSEQQDPAEVAAYHRLHPRAAQRVRATCWRTAEDSAGPVVARRLAGLREQAEAEEGRPVPWQTPRHRPAPPTRRDRAADAGCGVAAGAVALLVLVLLVVGAVTTVRWLLHLTGVLG